MHMIAKAGKELLWWTGELNLSIFIQAELISLSCYIYTQEYTYNKEYIYNLKMWQTMSHTWRACENIYLYLLSIVRQALSGVYSGEEKVTDRRWREGRRLNTILGRSTGETVTHLIHSYAVPESFLSAWLERKYPFLVLTLHLKQNI